MKRVAVLLYEDFQLLDAAGPIAAFELAERLMPGSYEIVPVSLAGGAVASSVGMTTCTSRADAVAAPDTLIVVGGEGSALAGGHVATRAYLNAAIGSVRRLCSVCSGAQVLAAAGLLDRRRATTHWRLADELRTDYPGVRVEPDYIYVRDGAIWTSAGVTAGIDLALALIADDHGEPLARRVAQEMVVYYRRPGGQSQFSTLTELTSGGHGFSALLTWIRGNLASDLTVECLAQQAAMSRRNFYRRFLAAFGVGPAKVVERLRLEVARERVENTRAPIETIALACGFQDPERMRRAFLRNFGLPPQAMRRVRGAEPSPEAERPVSRELRSMSS